MKDGKRNLREIVVEIDPRGKPTSLFRSEKVKVRKKGMLEIWKTIKLGTGLKTADDFRKALEDNGFDISYNADDFLGKTAFTVAAEETTIDLVKVTEAELGLKKAPTSFDQIYEYAKKLELKLCPFEVGLQLRLQYPDQPIGGASFRVGMEPIVDSDGRQHTFIEESDGLGIRLDANWSDFSLWTGWEEWVFRK